MTPEQKRYVNHRRDRALMRIQAFEAARKRRVEA